MTPHSIRDKGDELIGKFRKDVFLGIVEDTYLPATQCAIIATECVISVLIMLPVPATRYWRAKQIEEQNQILQYLKEKV